ncbi:MAG TPA: C45 family autoproteolytic acyltransferase/hydrolase [Bdellovibrionota bacterium]|jgi:hypothetical protein|nr:C45 family autoproteolytic acyltransferase/hydrolase [Bdellovibrionota bacterium]
MNALWAYFLGMAVAVPMGPVGTRLLRIPDRKWYRCLAMMLSLDLALATLLVLASEAFLSVTSHPWAKLLSGLFLIGFALHGLSKRKPEVGLEMVEHPATIRGVLSLALANPGTYLLMASAFLFFDMSASTSFALRWLTLAALSLGAISWYHVVRTIFVRQSPRIQFRIERALFVVVGTLGAFTFFTSLSKVAHASSLSPVSCVRVAHHGASLREDCTVKFSGGGSKVVHALTLQGAGSQIAYDHGYLMALEAETGVLMQTHQAIGEALQQGSIVGRGLKRQIFECMRSRVENSVNEEFLADMNAFYDGYSARMRELGRGAKFSRADVSQAALAIELSIIMEGMARRSETNQSAVLSEMASMCGVRIPLVLVEEVFGILNPFKHGGLKLGCIGGVLPEAQSSLGSLTHIRNLDGNLVETWNKAPVVALVKRQGSYPFVAGATAGLIYVGGISGYNAHGISASLHEMSTERYQRAHGGRRGMLAPAVMQKIFERAKNLDEAIAIIRAAGHFGAWTFLVSDAKTGEAVSVEVSGFRVSVARRSQNRVMAQSNHFVAKDMGGEAFTYSFNKQLESWSRYQFMEASLKVIAPGAGGVDQMIDVLSGHRDVYEGRRAFGRTATKAYTIMSNIMVPEADQFWMTAGERMPASHSNFVGFHVDFGAARLKPIEARRTDQYLAISSWERSLASYVDARLAYVHGDKWKAIEHMKRAQTLARQSKINEPVYLYILGRLYFEVERYDLAAVEFNQLVAQTGSLHDFGKAMLGLYQMANMVNSGYPRDATFEGYVDKTGKRLWTLYKKHWHFDLKKKIDLYDQLRQGKKVKMPEIDFVTVE